jgi:hypothetical protein
MLQGMSGGREQVHVWATSGRLGQSWEEGERASPKMNSTLFYLFESFPKRLELIRSKDVLSVLEKFRIKYGFDDFGIRNNFPY